MKINTCKICRLGFEDTGRNPKYCSECDPRRVHIYIFPKRSKTHAKNNK